MTQDAPSLRDDSRVNGAAKLSAASVGSRPLPDICNDIRRRVTAFLDETVEDEILRGAQSQVRVSVGVIEDALKRYG